jgi:hypothetical protein
MRRLVNKVVGGSYLDIEDKVKSVAAKQRTMWLALINFNLSAK